MNKFLCQKIVRDQCTEQLIEAGIEVEERSLDRAGTSRYIKEKLVEEAKEVVEAKSLQEVTEELADVLEVVKAVARFHGISESAVEEARQAKRKRRGGFEKYCYIESIRVPDGHPKLAYYVGQPEAYPQVS